MVVPALVALALLIVAYPPGDFELSLESFLAGFPGWLEPLWQLVYDLFAVWALALLVGVLASRRPDVFLEALGALLLALLTALVSARLADGSWPDLGGAIGGGSDASNFPALRVTACAAVILTVGVHLVRPLKALGRWVIGCGVAAALLTAAAPPSGIAAALFIAVAAAAAPRLALGTSAGQPGLHEVEAALAELGVTGAPLAAAAPDGDAVFVCRGRDGSGRDLLVKVYGRDAYTDQFLSKCWRAIAYRESGPGLRASRTQAVEHEAFITLLALAAGARSHEVVTAGVSADGDALLVLAGSVTPLSALDDVEDALLHDAWRAHALLESANIGHLRISPATLVLVDRRVGFVGFSAGTVSPTAHQQLADRAALLATTVSLVGVERAVSTSRASLGTEGVTALLPYLQPAAFSPALRRALKESGLKPDDLLEQVSGVVGAEPPSLLKLRRVDAKSLFQVALLLLAASAIASAATSVDVQQLTASFQDAAWAWIVLGFFVAQLPRLTLALSTMGSLVAKLRFGPVWVKQLSEPYLSLALPSGVARMALSIRFFQRQGVPPPVAVASGAIESLAGNVVQVVLLVSLLAFSEATLAFDLAGPGDSGMRKLLVILLVVVALSVMTLVVVGRLRHAITARVRRWWPDVRETLGTLRSPNKIGLVLLANVATEVLFAGALGLFAHAFGASIPLTELLVISISVSLLGSFVPVPGGIGVVEWGLAVGLTASGMSETAAFATVFCHRLSTFYLPAVWGFFATGWLQKNRYL